MPLKKLDGFKNVMARHRAKNKAAGLCIYCPKTRVEGRTLCLKHLADARIYQARIRECFRKFGSQMVDPMDKMVRGQA